MLQAGAARRCLGLLLPSIQYSTLSCCLQAARRAMSSCAALPAGHLKRRAALLLRLQEQGKALLLRGGGGDVGRKTQCFTTKRISFPSAVVSPFDCGRCLYFLSSGSHRSRAAGGKRAGRGQIILKIATDNFSNPNCSPEAVKQF